VGEKGRSSDRDRIWKQGSRFSKKGRKLPLSKGRVHGERRDKYKEKKVKI